MTDVIVNPVDYTKRYAPTYIGPTWQVTDDGYWNLPEHSLGWQIAGWCAEYLHGPDGTGQWTFTPEQMRWLLHFYALKPDGSWLYRRAYMMRSKGVGKDFIGAVVALAEMCGPVRFSHWGDDGKPVGRPEPSAWVQIVATSEPQTRTTTNLFPALMSKKFIADYQVEPGIEMVRALGGKVRIQAVAASFRALEGARPTLTIANEVQHWVRGNRGLELWETLTGNTAKVMNGRYLVLSNAFVPGLDSVAERLRNAWEDVQTGRAPDTGFMYDSIEAHPETPLEPDVLRAVLPLIAGDAHWLDTEDLIGEIMSTSNPPEASYRKYLNAIVAGDEKLHTQADWAKLAVSEHRELRAGDDIVLGFDGSKTRDATALIALRVRDRLVVPLGIWERPLGLRRDDHWEVPRDEVNSAVARAVREYGVKAFYCDVEQWSSEVSEWSLQYGDQITHHASTRNAVAWDMRAKKKEVANAHERLLGDIAAGKLAHQGEATALSRLLRQHVLNANRRDTAFGVIWGKDSRDSDRKVDAYAALVAASAALNDYEQSGKDRNTGGSRVWAF